MTIADSNLLLFQVGPVPCCVDSDTAQIVIEPPTHITAIPGSNAYRPGLMVYAKRAVSVYDVRTKFNLSTEQRGKIIITEMGNQLFGFWVDRIQAVLLSSEGKWQILPTECPKELFEAMFMYKEQLIFKTNFNALAKAQVDTQTQRFINKLLNEEKTKEETLTTKTTSPFKSPPQTEVKEDNKPTKPLPEKNKPIKPEPSIKPLEKPTANLKTDLSSKTSNKNRSGNIIKKTTPISTNPANNLQKKNIPTNSIKTERNKSTKGPLTTDSQHSYSSQTKQVPSSNSHSNTERSSFIKKTIENQTPIKARKEVNNAYEISVIKESKNKSRENQPSINNNNETKQQSGVFALILLLALVIGVPALSWFLFFDSRPTDARQTKQRHQPLTATKKQTIDIKEQPTPPISPREITLEKEEITIDKTISKNEPTNIDRLEKPITSTKEIEEEIQSTKIINTDNTITITIDDSDAEFNETDLLEDKTDSVLTSKIEDKETTERINTESRNQEDSVTIKVETTNSTSNDKIKLPPSPSSKRIIHIIVKGDTLWHIAKRYINNPYKYPQLAKLSKIKNPDLIYPGNRVIIIIKNHKTK